MRKMTDTSMSAPMAAALTTAVLTASDGTSISAGHLPHEGDLCLVVASKAGRAFMRTRGTRIDSQGWPEPMPEPPVEAITRYPHLPVLIVHGDVDRYFPLEHPRALHAAAVASANDRVELWEIPGFGHAESAIDDLTLARIADWVREQISRVDS